jgi:hypothetical protein
MEDSMPTSGNAGNVAKGPKWTVMIFMGAATINGNAPLMDAAEADLKEMAQVGSGGPLELYVQLHEGGGKVPRRKRVVAGMSHKIASLPFVPPGERELARGQALLNFVSSSLKAAGHRPRNRQHYSLLVLWGHAYNFAFGRELTSQGLIDALDFAELSGVLESLQREFRAPNAKLDIVGFDACDVATVEMACQLERFAKYLLGSEIGIPLPGWPYDRILDRLRHPKGDLMGPAEFGTFAVRRFCESYTADQRTVSLTLLNLECASDIFARAEVLAQMLTRAMGDASTRERIAALFKDSQTEAGKPFVDVADLCLNLLRHSDDPFVSRTAREFGDFLISARGAVVGKSNDGTVRPFVIEHGRNASETARLNGVSMYAPHVVPEKDFAVVRHLYDKFDLARDTRWSRLVHALAGSQ